MVFGRRLLLSAFLMAVFPFVVALVPGRLALRTASRLSLGGSGVGGGALRSRRIIQLQQSATAVLDLTNAPTKSSGSGTASMRVSSVNLLKNMVGAGVFSLNAKCSAISPAAFLPSSALVVTMAAWATYNFYMIAETCKMTSTSTYGEAWGKTVSEGSKWLVQLVVTVAPIVSCLANSIVLTDILGIVYRALGAPAWMYSSRNMVIGLLSTTILYPLCIQPDLSALKSVSAFGLLGHLSAMVALAVRMFDKSYFAGGKFYRGSPLEAAALAIASTKKTKVAVAAAVAVPFDISKMFILASLLSYCFVCHYNAPRYYSELAGKEQDQGLFLKMAATSYGLGAAIYIGTMWLGLGLFGPRSASFALNSFSASDPLGLLARVAFGSSVLASYPLIFINMRNFFATAASKFSPNIKSEAVTALLLAFISLLTSRFTDIGVVGSLAGGILSSSMMFVFPPIMYMRALLQQARSTNSSPPVFKLVLNTVLLICGGLLGGFGTFNSLKMAFAK